MHWYLKNKNVEVKIDPDNFPEAEEVSFDVETDEKDNIVSIAVCGDTKSVSVYFGESVPRCISYLSTRKLIAHQARADVRWLAPHGITMKHISWDTMLADYVINANQDSFGLKELAWKWLSMEWPKYKALTTDPAFIQMACELNPALMIIKVRKYKTKPDKIEGKFPKKLTLDKLPREIVANYNAWDAYATFMLKKSQLQRATPTALAYMQKIEFPTSALLYEVENKGIKMDVKKLLIVHKTFLKRAYTAKHDFANHVGKDVLITSPVQVLKALRKYGMAVADTNEDTLVQHKDSSIVKALLEFRGCAKICSTYTKPLFKRAMKDPNHRVYPSFLQHTITGRLSCRNPNLQNQPPELRECFIVEAGNLFGNGDWSQIELRVPAHYSLDPLMVENFVQAKEKFHAMTARQINKPYKVGKTVNFLLTNSGGPKRLAEIAEISEEEAVDAYNAHKETFKVFWEWIESQKAIARQNGGMTTLYGRFVSLPDLRNRDFKIKAYAERQAISIKVQGSAADMMKAAMLKLWYKYGLVPVVTVHDEFMYEEPINNIEKVQYQMKDVMESIIKLRVPLVADIGVGDSWATAKKKD